MALPVVVDCDGGVDDCTALWWALVEPGLDVVAVTTVGGVVGPDQAARNVAKVLHAAGRADVPVAVGGGEAAAAGGGPRRHGSDGLGDCRHPDVPFALLDEPAPALLARLAGVTLVALGPLTNVAALARAPHDLAGLVVMGGDLNLGCDPAAAAEVASASWAAPPLLVTLDAGFAATLHDEELAVLARRRTPQAAFLACPIESYARHARLTAPDGGCPSHDTLAMASLVHPDLLEVEDRPPWRVAVGADGDRFRALMRAFLDRAPEAAPEHVA